MTRTWQSYTPPSTWWDNIYNADGALTDDRLVDTDGNKLKFSGQIPNSDLTGEMWFDDSAFSGNEKGLYLATRHDEDGNDILSSVFVGDATDGGDEDKSIQLRIGKSSNIPSQINVFLESYNSSKVNAIKAVKDFLGISLGDAKTLVESAPVVVLEDTTQAIADDFVSELTAGGSTAYVQYVNWASKETKLDMQYNGIGNSPTISMISISETGEKSFVKVADEKITADSKLIELGSGENSEAKVTIQDTPNLPWVIVEHNGGEIFRITDTDLTNDIKFISDWLGTSLDMVFDGWSGNLQVLSMQTGLSTLGNNKLLSGQGFGEIEFAPIGWGESTFIIKSKEVKIGDINNTYSGAKIILNSDDNYDNGVIIGRNGWEMLMIEDEELGNKMRFISDWYGDSFDLVFMRNDGDEFQAMTFMPTGSVDNKSQLLIGDNFDGVSFSSVHWLLSMDSQGTRLESIGDQLYSANKHTIEGNSSYGAGDDLVDFVFGTYGGWAKISLASDNYGDSLEMLMRYNGGNDEIALITGTLSGEVILGDWSTAITILNQNIRIDGMPTDNNVTHVLGKNGVNGTLRNVEVSSLGGILKEKITQNIVANTPTTITFSNLTEYYTILIEDSSGNAVSPSIRRLTDNSAEITVAVTDDYTIRVMGI